MRHNEYGKSSPETQIMFGCTSARLLKSRVASGVYNSSTLVISGSRIEKFDLNKSFSFESTIRVDYLTFRGSYSLTSWLVRVQWSWNKTKSLTQLDIESVVVLRQLTNIQSEHFEGINP